MEWAKKLEEIERVKAKERQAINGSKNLGLNVVNGTPLEGQKGKIRDIVAKEKGKLVR